MRNKEYVLMNARKEAITWKKTRWYSKRALRISCPRTHYHAPSWPWIDAIGMGEEVQEINPLWVSNTVFLL